MHAYADSLQSYKYFYVEKADTDLNYIHNKDVDDQENSNFGVSSRAQTILKIVRKNLEARLLFEQEQRDEEQCINIIERQNEAEKLRQEHPTEIQEVINNIQDIELAEKDQENIEDEQEMNDSEILQNTINSEAIE